ncbi:hypothetical protein JCM19239_5158 [Vibrio variabilis]|uniref:Uncharacterized protein n=1 Tax=Vibrio variabilis TaxID=990271 RepID=A0ABQ0J923_9VIBR|nr:hypothetical protein JCM19239_5158 [Vibrio variabilis]
MGKLCHPTLLEPLLMNYYTILESDLGPITIQASDEGY